MCTDHVKMIKLLTNAARQLQVVNWFDTQRRKRTRLGLPFEAPMPSPKSLDSAKSKSLPPSQTGLKENSLLGRQSSSLSQALLSQKKTESRAVSEAEELLLREIGISSPAAEEKLAGAVISLIDNEDESLEVKLAPFLDSDVGGMPNKPQRAAQPTTRELSPNSRLTAEIGKENCTASIGKPQCSQEQLVGQSAAPVEDPLPPNLQGLQCTIGHETLQPRVAPRQATPSGIEPSQQFLSMQTPQAIPPEEDAVPAGIQAVQGQYTFETPQAAIRQGEAAMHTAAEGPKAIQFPAASSHVEWSPEWIAQQSAHFKAVSAAATEGVKSVVPLQPLPGQALKTISKQEVGLEQAPHKL